MIVKIEHNYQSVSVCQK